MNPKGYRTESAPETGKPSAAAKVTVNGTTVANGTANGVANGNH